jgi:hypothetical protein
LINNNCQQDINEPSVNIWLFRLNWLVGTVGLICWRLHKHWRTINKK